MGVNGGKARRGAIIRQLNNVGVVPSFSLNSDRAIQVNIQIMRTFTKLREMLATHKDLQKKIDEMEKKYDHQFKIIFDTIRQLLAPPEPKKKNWRVLNVPSSQIFPPLKREGQGGDGVKE